MPEPERRREQDAPATRSPGGAVVQATTINGGVHVHTSAPHVPTTTPGDAFTVLVDTLLAVPCVRDEAGRRLLLSRLRQEISAAVPHQQRARLHVIELVRTCRDYGGGLTDLLRVLQELEGDSIPVRRSGDAIHALIHERPRD